MKIFTDSDKTKNGSLSKINLTYVEHNDEELEFITDAKIELGTNVINIYTHINDYINTVFDDDKKCALFDLYKRAYELFNPINIEDVEKRELYLSNITNHQFLSHELKPIIRDILDLIDYNNIVHFITLSDKNILHVPSAVEESAKKGEYPPETTIYSEDYKNLIKMIMYLRPILPIVLNYINNIAKSANKEYIEILGGELFESNYVLNSTPGYNKLITYMRYSQADDQISKELDVLSEQNYIKYVVSKTLISKLLPSQIPSMDKSKNLSKLMYGGSKGLNGSKKITSPIHSNGGWDDKDKRSMLESFKIKARVNQHKEMAQCDYFLMGVMDEYNNLLQDNLFSIQCAGLGIKNRALVEKLYKLIPNEWDFKLENHISVLGQLVFFEKISPECVYSLDYNQLKSYMALAQAKLFEMGYPYLSLLMTAMFSYDDVPTNTLDLFSLTKEEKEKLLEICYITDDDKHASRNRAVVAVNEFLDSVGSNSLVSTVSLDMLLTGSVMTDDHPLGSTYEVPIERNIKDEFINLILTVNK